MGRFLWIVLRAPAAWTGLVGFLLGALAAYGTGEGAGFRQGFEEGRLAEHLGNLEAQLQQSRDAIRDREAGEDDATDEWNRAGGDLERLCEADPACRDRHELRLDEEDRLVVPGHAADREGGAGAQRHQGEALPSVEEGVR